jgi:hypothetical protein
VWLLKLYVHFSYRMESTSFLEMRPRRSNLAMASRTAVPHGGAAGMTGVFDDRQFSVRPGLSKFPRREQWPRQVEASMDQDSRNTPEAVSISQQLIVVHNHHASVFQPGIRRRSQAGCRGKLESAHPRDCHDTIWNSRVVTVLPVSNGKRRCQNQMEPEEPAAQGSDVAGGVLETTEGKVITQLGTGRSDDDRTVTVAERLFNGERLII